MWWNEHDYGEASCCLLQVEFITRNSPGETAVCLQIFINRNGRREKDMSLVQENL
jgi:hypothetical protein